MKKAQYYQPREHRPECKLKIISQFSQYRVTKPKIEANKIQSRARDPYTLGILLQLNSTTIGK